MTKPKDGCECDLRDRRWNPYTRRCKTCGRSYLACDMSASPQGISCVRPIGHRGEHLSQDGTVIKAPKDYRGH